MKVGIVGGGVVGRATARTYLEFVDEVRVYDTVGERSTHTLGEVVLSDIVFICTHEDIVPSVCQRFLGISQNFVIKSTVSIGTTRRLAQQYNLPNLVHSPEFLTARCAEVDALIPAQNIIGLAYYTHPTPLYDLYKLRFPGVPIRTVTSDVSEAIKLMTNAFFAIKVATFNEFRSLADKLKLDWDDILQGILGDGRITAHHTKVPGPDGQRGFGGSCLKKDSQHLLQSFVDNGVLAGMIPAAIVRNEVDRAQS